MDCQVQNSDKLKMYLFISSGELVFCRGRHLKPALVFQFRIGYLNFYQEHNTVKRIRYAPKTPGVNLAKKKHVALQRVHICGEVHTALTGLQIGLFDIIHMFFITFTSLLLPFTDDSSAESICSRGKAQFSKLHFFCL